MVNYNEKNNKQGGVSIMGLAGRIKETLDLFDMTGNLCWSREELCNIIPSNNV